MRARAKHGMEYRDPKGKQTTCFANVAEKMGIDIVKAKEEAAKLGWEIPEEQLVKVVKKRGRPAKESGKGDEVVVKRKRGRKKKVSVMADQIADLVEAASQEVHATDEEKEAEVEEMKKKAAEAKDDAQLELVFTNFDKGFTTQTTCPIAKKPINPVCFSEKDGKKTFFCCGKCKAAFDKKSE